MKVSATLTKQERVDRVEWSDSRDVRLGRRPRQKQSYSLIPKGMSYRTRDGRQ